MGKIKKIKHTTGMLTIIFRCVIIYLIVLMLFRIMGKRQLGQMQPFELVLTLIIADLATIPMAEVSVPVLHGVVPLFTLVLLHFLLTFFTRISSTFGKIVSGKPVIVVNPKGIDYKALKALNLSVDDLFEGMRAMGYFSLEQVLYAIMETTGSLTIMPKAEFSPATLGDLKIKSEENALPINLVSEGKLMKDNLPVARVDEKFISNFISTKVKGGKIKKTLVMTLDKNGNVFLQMMKGESMTFENVEVPK